jgi:hypothetical protein
LATEARIADVVGEDGHGWRPYSASPEAIIASIVAGTSDARHTRATAEAHKGAGALVEAVV